MKELKEGHSYELGSYQIEGVNCETQILHFMKKVNGTMTMVGTTNEEVLKMMIHRIKYLQKKMPCHENNQAVLKLEECLMWLNYRTHKRLVQDVEGTDIPHKS